MTLALKIKLPMALGVGKGTLMKKVFTEFGNKVGLSVSHTTRSPRDGEEDGKHYHFVSKEAFEKQIEEGTAF